ncbi:MAG: hypothetical protein ACHBNF_05980 [Chromatiales bacterium]
MNETQLKKVAQLRAFLNGTLAVGFQPIGEDSLRYEHIAAVLRRLGYRRLKRPDKGVVLRYLERTTGYSRQQLTRLVRRGLDGEVLAKRYAPPWEGFRRKFTPADVALLAETHALHGTLAGVSGDEILVFASHSRNTSCEVKPKRRQFGNVSLSKAQTAVVDTYNPRRLPANTFSVTGLWTHQ